MQIPEIPAWRWFPPIALPSPVLALSSGAGGVWAGGVGGVAWRATGGEWAPRVSGLPLTRVAALTYAGGWLLAGGAEGIARSGDAGRTWQRAEVRGAARVAALVASPRMAEEAVALAATVGDGILRTSDAGRTWEPANFGLPDLEVTALAWGAGEIVLAGTAGGIYRSPNGGRAWRAAAGSEELPVAALSWLPNGAALAVLEDGSLLRSSDGGARWSPFGALPAGTLATALMATPAGVLLGTASHGILGSRDGGATWAQIVAGEVLSLAADQATLYAGTTDGLLASDTDGVDWRATPAPPIHDLRRLIVVGAVPLVAGAYSGLVRYHPESGWEALPSAPTPLSALAAAPGGALFAAGVAGLARSTDAGTTWQIVAPGEPGWVEHLTFDADGLGWAGSADGQRLLRTQDGGASWEACAAPFGVLRLAALQATPGALIAVTYEAQLQIAQPWRSFDGGQTWERGAQVQTAWPIVATCPTPPLFTLGATVYAQRPDGDWGQSPIGNFGVVRRVVGASGTLLALTTAGVYRSLDYGITWTRWDEELPIDQIMDLALEDGRVYALLAGGQVCSVAL